MLLTGAMAEYLAAVFDRFQEPSFRIGLSCIGSVSTEAANDVPTSLGDVVALMSLPMRFLAEPANVGIRFGQQVWWQIFRHRY